MWWFLVCLLKMNSAFRNETNTLSITESSIKTVITSFKGNMYRSYSYNESCPIVPRSILGTNNLSHFSKNRKY